MFISIETGPNETQLFNFANIERIVHEHSGGCVTLYFNSGHSLPLRGAGAAALLEQLEQLEIDCDLEDHDDNDGHDADEE
jgi:hypothetical protein